MKEKQQKAEETSMKNSVGTRGRTFAGFVIKKFPKRVVVDFERTVFVKKYERFFKKKTRLHARLPQELESSINIGDYIQVRETRPLSKIIHFLVIKKIRSATSEENKK